MLFMAFMSWAGGYAAAESWRGQDAYEQVFGLVPRIVLASIVAFWAGEFVNSFVLAKMKVWTQGKALWSRTIGSTAGTGCGLDAFLSDSVFGHLANRRCTNCDGDKLVAQSGMGSIVNSSYLPCCKLFESQ